MSHRALERIFTQGKLSPDDLRRNLVVKRKHALKLSDHLQDQLRVLLRVLRLLRRQRGKI